MEGVIHAVAHVHHVEAVGENLFRQSRFGSSRALLPANGGGLSDGTDAKFDKDRHAYISRWMGFGNMQMDNAGRDPGRMNGWM